MGRVIHVIFVIIVLSGMIWTPVYGVDLCDDEGQYCVDSLFGTSSDLGSFSIDTQSLSWMEVDLLHAQGFKGQDTTIAIIDSGVASHTYFTDTLNTQLKKYIFVEDEVSNYALTKTNSWSDKIVKDHIGHGTKVAGVALQFAPMASLIVYRTEFYDSSDGLWKGPHWTKVKYALEDMLSYQAEYQVDILVMSIGTESSLPSGLRNEINLLLAALVDSGISIFIASGNAWKWDDNPDEYVSWPASLAPQIEGLMSVGGVFDKDYVAYKGLYPRDAGEIWYERHGDNIIQGTSHNEEAGPYELEIMASGVELQSTISTDFDENGILDDGTSDFTGTSAAAPVAAGSAACLYSKWKAMSGFSIIPPDFVEGTLRNMAVYRDPGWTLGQDNTLPRAGDEIYYYGDGIVSPYDCMIYPISIAGYTIMDRYMFTRYDSEFYGHPYSVYLEWKELNGRSWVTHNDLVAQTYNTNWNAFHAQNSIHPAFYSGFRTAAINLVKLGHSLDVCLK